MPERWAKIDIAGTLLRACEAVFMLDETGKLVFANPALHQLFGIPAGNEIGWRELSNTILAPPLDLPIGSTRQADRLHHFAEDSKWVRLVFQSLTDERGEPIGSLGIARPIEAVEQTRITSAADAELLARLEKYQAEQKTSAGGWVHPTASLAGQRLWQQVIMASGTRNPVTFVGPAGTGKRTLVQTLHDRAKTKGAIFAMDGEQTSEGEIRQQLFGNPSTNQLGILANPRVSTLAFLHLSSFSRSLLEDLVRDLSGQRHSYRIIATERQPLETLRANDEMSASVYYFFSRLVIPVPALAERMADLPDFCGAILARQATKGMERLLPAETMEFLAGYDWPGNLRELATVLGQAAKQASKPQLLPGDFPNRLGQRTAATNSLAKLPLPLDAVLEKIEAQMMRSAFERFAGNKSKAAEFLGISRARFHRRWDQIHLLPSEETSDSANDNDFEGI